MKKLIAIISFIALATAAMAQTAEEIITRMEAEMSKQDESEGTAMTMDMKRMKSKSRTQNPRKNPKPKAILSCSKTSLTVMR